MQKSVWGLALALILNSSLWAETSPLDTPKLLPELQVLTLLTQALNDITENQNIDFKIIPITSQSVKILKAPVFSEAKKTEPSLPALSTDDTLINPVDLTAFGYSENSLGPAQNEASSPGLLPLPQARVTGSQKGTSLPFSPSATPVEAAPLGSDPVTEPDVLTQFSPKNTRFGKDRYDSDLFSSVSPNPTIGNTLNLGPAPEPEQSSNNTPEEPGEEATENPEEKKLKQAKEDFKKTMLEFAERTEEIEAFRLVDYYDLKNIFTKNEQVLSVFDDDEIDLRFVENVQTVYDRFGPKDSTAGKQPFERFLNRMQPVVKFQSYRNNFFKAEKQKRARHQPD